MQVSCTVDQIVERDVDGIAAGGEGDGVAAFTAGEDQRAAFEGFVNALFAGLIASDAAQQVDR